MEKVKKRRVVPMNCEWRRTDMRLGPRDQDGRKTDHGWLTFGDINKQVYMWKSRLC